MTYLSHRKGPNKEVKTSENQIVFILDLTGNFKFFNAAAERIFGYSRQEACRMNIAHVVAPAVGDYVRQQISDALNGHFGAVYEIEIITKDRRRVILETSTQLMIRNGEPFELHGIAFPAVRVTDVEANLPPRCLDKEFVSMLLVPVLASLTDRDRKTINLGR